MTEQVEVYGRVRPSSSNEEEAVEVIDSKTVKLAASNRKDEKIYTLHRFFPANTEQNEIFEVVAQKIVKNCTEGINGTIFAYGQTGSGKTHTMLGPNGSWNDAKAMGLIPRSIAFLYESLLEKQKQCSNFSFDVRVEFVELYNEKIYDLLNCDQKKVRIQLRDNGAEVLLVGVTSELVENYSEMMHVVKKGWESRRTAETAMNRDSSRSHALLIVKVNVKETIGALLTTRRSTLNLVDLAGSERQEHSKASGDRLKEATHINGSLSVLGRCIRVLADKKSTGMSYVPLRDSNLTHILKNSLGGNSKTAVIVNMHPGQTFISDTFSTLQFASQCSMIKNHVRKNEEMNSNQESAYKDAIQQLRQQMEEVEKRKEHEKLMAVKEINEESIKWKKLANFLEIENKQLRLKYKLSLVQSRESIDTSEPFEQQLQQNSLKQHLTDNRSIQEIYEDDLRQQIDLLKLELEAKNKDYDLLRTELAEARSKMTEFLNNSISVLRTPKTQKRISKTRNPKRETLYAPSARNVFLFNEEDDDEKDAGETEKKDTEDADFNLLEIQYQECLARNVELQKLQEEAEDKLKKIIDSTIDKEKHALEVQHKQKQRNLQLEDQLKNKEREIKELIEKLENSTESLNTARDEIQKKNEETLMLEKSMKNMQEKRQIEVELIIEERDKIHEINKMLEKKYQNYQLENEKIIANLKLKIEQAEVSIKVKRSENQQLETAFVKKIEEMKKIDAEWKSKFDKLLEEKEDILEEKKRISKICDDLKQNISEMLEKHQVDIEDARKSSEKLVESWKSSYEFKCNALDTMKSSYEKNERALINNFESKLDNEKARVLQEVEGEIEELKEKAEYFKKKLKESEARCGLLEKQRKEDSDVISQQFGSSNKAQKIKYIQSIREENRGLKDINERLRLELDELKKPKKVERKALEQRN